MFSLKNKTALVIGGKGKIGLEVSCGLAEQGAKVIVASRNTKTSKDILSRFDALDIQIVKMDASIEAEVNNVIDKITENISKDLIEKKIKTIDMSMKKDFGIQRPKIAVLSINPHVGDDGIIGNQDQEILIPALKELSESYLIFGPFPSDSFFGSDLYKKYDAILAIYHDQGLIPFKTIAFGNGVNFTAGLNVVRTSPVHGTAYEIAGQGIADERSFREAVFTACDIYKKRVEFEKLNKNPLSFKS